MITAHAAVLYSILSNYHPNRIFLALLRLGKTASVRAPLVQGVPLIDGKRINVQVSTNKRTCDTGVMNKYT